MTFRLFSCVFLLGWTAALAEEPESSQLEKLVGRTSLWNASAEDLADSMQALQFEWTSSARDTARSVRPGLTFGGEPLSEALLRFQGGRLSEIRLIYFNRGDAGELRDDQFDALIEAITRNLSAATSRPHVERGRSSASAVKAQGRAWHVPGTEYVLEWSATKASPAKLIPFRAEFIRLTIRPEAGRLAIGASATTSRDAVRRFVGKEHVERLSGGDVRVKDMPMVDQGDKSYCVVASVERVIRYYGGTVDQHELAQIADSDASGTSLEAIYGSLKRLTARLGLKVRSFYQWDLQEFLNVMEEYNRATKRGKLAKEVDISGPLIDPNACLRQIDPALFKAVRLKQSGDFSRFQREVQRSIDEGIPLLWAVQLGIVEEKELPEAYGGHMRLIIGYNSTTKEILYSDSWGMGHELKRMPIDDAWTITHGLSNVLPIS